MMDEDRRAAHLDLVGQYCGDERWLNEWLRDGVAYCRRRQRAGDRPSAAVMWAKLCEWCGPDGRGSGASGRWVDQSAERSIAVEAFTAQCNALVEIIDRWWPEPASAPVVVQARPTPIEDTIFERHGSLGEIDPDRAAAVARVLAASGLPTAAISVADAEPDAAAISVDGA